MRDITMISEFISENRKTGNRFLELMRAEQVSVRIVHHNDADGIAAAAALALAFEKLGYTYRLFPIEKIYERLVEKLHVGTDDVIIYADLGGQSSGLIGRYAAGNRQVIILDHHLPGGPVPGNTVHLNPELFEISGDDEASGASVCALFARELLREAGLNTADDEAWLAVLSVIGAVGDGQERNGTFTGMNEMFFAAATKEGSIQKVGSDLIVPRLQERTVREIVEIVTLLGSVGFYSGDASTAGVLLLGGNQDEAVRRAEELEEIKTASFEREVERIRREGLAQSDHFQWIDVQDRFAPMGVKAIGLFLELLIAQGLTEKDKYLFGFQYLPAEIPGIGRLETGLTKISSRLHPELRGAIEAGKRPDFMTLVPDATALVEGTADGCHRFAAGSTIDRGREEDFIRALEMVLHKNNPASAPADQ
ncbi:MAG: DHH family phosphoesterase [Deltaproteobacteria bacterium]|nr:DHH family phosphoesterase [Deltaproteobacteria bacterium]